MRESAGHLPPLSVGDHHHLLLFVSEALRSTTADFPGADLSALLRDLVDADFAGAGEIDFRGTASRRWADTPDPVDLDSQEFHDVVARHPLTAIYRSSLTELPLRLSDIVNPRVEGPFPGSGTADVIVIPLAAATSGIKVLVLMRPAFDQRHLLLARYLQPVLAQLHALTRRLGPAPEAEPREHGPATPFRDEGIMLTARELAVLDLMADGLISGAIARRLGISPRTVSKHIESIYRKLGSHDRTSAVLRGSALGLLSSPRATVSGTGRRPPLDPD